MKSEIPEPSRRAFIGSIAAAAAASACASLPSPALAGREIWKYDGPLSNGLVQEHVDWVTAIRTGRPINTARETALSTLMAIQGRDSAYTGKAVSWDDLLASTTRLRPADYAFGPVALKPSAPLPGVDQGPPLDSM